MRMIDLRFRGYDQAIACFLLETSAGLAIFETGPHSTLAHLQASLAALGYESNRLTDVFLTHIHLDHAGAAWALAEHGATIHVHPAGVRHLVDPARLLRSARQIYQDQMEELWGEVRPIAENRIRAATNGERFSLGDQDVYAWHTPGHARHHISWQIGAELICGDVCGVKIGAGPVVPPCPPPDIHLGDWRESLALVRGLSPKKLHLTHFGPISKVEAHLDALESELFAWADWIRKRRSAGQDQVDMTPAFEHWVEERLKARGVNEAGLRRYNAANPAWMSVAGLMRYWSLVEAEG